MGKKSKKNRFNQSVDVDIVYSSNTIAEMDPTDNLAELNLSSEKAEELQKIRAKLPTFTSTSSVESELAKLPMEKPFRAFVYNVSYSATEQNVADFFSPLKVTNINIVGGDGGSRGFCFVDFASRDDLAKALERSDSSLAGRQVNVRIAAPNNVSPVTLGFAMSLYFSVLITVSSHTVLVLSTFTSSNNFQVT
ncbi:unnamed protein product [Schistosoma mattheei]|uniref:Uncharacterized protein n=2 Tax=Schistosoma TaxID=6181 RepID=A0A183NLE4_9TREM|nr:unnamed protein product [Schistosoma mattheei]